MRFWQICFVVASLVMINQATGNDLFPVQDPVEVVGSVDCPNGVCPPGYRVQRSVYREWNAPRASTVVKRRVYGSSGGSYRSQVRQISNVRYVERSASWAGSGSNGGRYVERSASGSTGGRYVRRVRRFQGGWYPGKLLRRNLQRLRSRRFRYVSRGYRVEYQVAPVEYQVAPVEVYTSTQPVEVYATGSPVEVSGPQWRYNGGDFGAPLANHVWQVHGEYVRRLGISFDQLQRMSDAELRATHSAAHNASQRAVYFAAGG